uniref:HECT domain-containing protein n=1 Tax=Sparus aurata TaxID=8175 RepID=A0A671V683_SPAAU
RMHKPSEELTLLQAGLGRRTVNIPEDANHKEVRDYPKMTDLEGAWMLHKAMGGSGQRKLNLVSPEEAGYTGASLVKTWGGKGCLYIMPIQHTLDITPLPFTSPEFQAMPKARCVSCQEYVPLQLLSLHAETCAQTKGNDEVWLVACPLCCEVFSENDILTHASACGENNVVSIWFCSVSAILLSLQKKIDQTQTFNISVTRQDMYERGMRQWSRQKKGSPKNPLVVSFIGEYGIDQGALRKEFLTEVMRGIEAHFFEGDGEKGKNPKYSLLDYQDNKFKTCGEIFATSLVQGGPAPNFLTRWCYHFLCHGTMDNNSVPNDVTSPDIKSNEDALLQLSDTIVACGYMGPIHVDHKKAITDAVSLHGLLRLIPILSQLREGLRLYGLDEVLGHHGRMCQQLFVPGFIQEVDSDFVVNALCPSFSEEGTTRRHREMKIINFLQDFLQKLEDREGISCQESHLFLQWVTGQGHLPLIETEREMFKISISFTHDCQTHYGEHSLCFPTVNACATGLNFPTQHIETFEDFEKNLTTAIHFGFDFSRH